MNAKVALLRQDENKTFMHPDTPCSVSGASVARFADIEILRYEIPGFANLPLERKLFIYHLSHAALAGRDITFDQNGRYSLRLRELFEGIYLHYEGERDHEEFRGVEEYLFRLWFSSGIHHHYGSEKFEPQFSRAYLCRLIEAVQAERGELLRFHGPELGELLEVIFNPHLEPRRTVQSGEKDLLQASSANFYSPGVTQQEAETFYREAYEVLTEEEQTTPPSLGLNSRLARREDGKLYEQTYRIGGLYDEALSLISAELHAALPYAEGERQRETILALLDYYKTGDLEQYNRCMISWVGDTQTEVDFINGFTEVYTDPLGMKGMWESLVHIRNHEASKRTEKLCREAAWFEKHAPIDERFKKEEPRGVTATVVSVAMLAGDSYPATPIGINLPNADWIRATHGSKSVTIDNIHEAYREASRHSGMDEVFIPNPEVRALLAKYDNLTDHLHTDLHECLGHGSGKLLPGVSADALGAYHSTLEEARADLFALYYMADEKLIELELLPNHEAYKACYYRYLLNGLVTQLVRIRPGHQLEEAHMRNRALIARYVLEHGEDIGALELRGLELIIHDYAAIQPIIGELLREVQRIKSTGDHEAGRLLVERYAISVDPELHREVLTRYTQLGIAPYKGFVNPRLEPVLEGDKIIDVIAHYDEGYAEQMLRYSREYKTLSTDPISLETLRHPEPSDATLEAAKELRSNLRHSMDGQVASSMRSKGLYYGINFGLTLDYIIRLAEKQPKTENLASYILSRDVRELKIIGQLIYPPECMTYEKATELALTVSSNPELRDYIAKNLFDRIPESAHWALDWVLCSNVPSRQELLPVAFTVLVRKITKGFIVQPPVWRQRLLNILLDILSDGMVAYPTTQQRTALLLLKRWGREDKAIREQILSSASLSSWRSSECPVLREFADDIIFELEEYPSN